MREADHHARLKAAYHIVIAAKESERLGVLRDVCKESPELRAELESLLSFEGEGRSLDGAAESLRHQWKAAFETPTRVGRFRIVRPIGSGSMGDVFLAEQDHPKRTVAVKMLHAAFTSGRHRRRFELESEILGRLDHRGIARILEAGCERERPYFVMEFVDGVPLTDHVRAGSRAVNDRIALLLDLCDAVAHAHQRGVVHRDLKPANILVDGEGQVRVLDFGVARASGTTDVETLQTHAGELMGTLPYMSPEQLDGDPDIDVRADVYAIGVIAFELLAGHRPIDVGDRSLAAAMKHMRSTAVPSLSTIAPNINADLAIIVGKATRELRSERYANVVELAADLRRWLNHEPITARAPSTMYQLRKFHERNRTLVRVGATSFALLIVAMVIVTIALIEMLDQRDVAMEAVVEADAQRDAARLASDATRRQRDAYLSVLAFAEIDPDRAEAMAVENSSDDAELDAILAHAYLARGMFVDARRHAIHAIDVLDQSPNSDPELLHELLWLSMRVDSLASYSTRVARWRAVNDAMLQETNPDLARLVRSLEGAKPDSWSSDYDHDLAGTCLDEVIRATQTLHNDDIDVQLVADRLEWLAHLTSGRRAHDLATRIIDASLDMRQRHLMETAPRVLRSRITRMDILLRARHSEQARQDAVAALQRLSPVLPDQHALLAMIRARLGRALIQLKRYDEALQPLRQAVAALPASLRPTSRELSDAIGDLMTALKETEVNDEFDRMAHAYAAAVGKGAHRIHWVRVRGRTPAALHTLEQEADRALTTRDPASVTESFNRFFEQWRAADDDNPDVSLVLANATRGWVDIWFDSGGWTTLSEPMLAEAERVARKHNANPLLLAEICALRIHHAARRGDLNDATQYFREGMDLVERQNDDIDWALMYLRLGYGRALAELGRPDEAIPILQLAHDQMILWYGIGGYNTQFVREAQSLAMHAANEKVVARAFDKARLDEALGQPTRQPRLLATAAWCVTRESGHDDETYRRALAAAEQAREVIQSSWLVNRSLAMAQIRCGQYQDALDTVSSVMRASRCERLELRAIEVLARVGLRDSRAGESFAAAQILKDHPEFAHDSVAISLFKEAAAAIDAGRRSN